MARMVVKGCVGCQLDVPAAAQQTTFIVHELRSNVMPDIDMEIFSGDRKRFQKTF